MNQKDEPKLFVERTIRILEEFNVEINTGSRILDFGCGDGDMVKCFIDKGFENTYGCDIVPAEDDKYELQSGGRLHLISPYPYRIPFEDNYFDIVFSMQVFEHVRDWNSALSEIKRIMKPGGVAFHVFPARWKPLETHVSVPLAGVFQSRSWLLMWAFLGVRSEFQKNKSANETADLNYRFLKENTNYLPGARIARHVKQHFGNFIFCEKKYLQFSSGRGKILNSMAKYIPFIPLLYNTLVNRVIMFRKK